tara:strand:+ start:1214 stop:1405 length:192 start_codon:yes stop_codon:yes gene_type:complete
MLKQFLISKMLTSKKWWYAVAGCLTTILSENLGLDATQTQNILYSIVALILGTGMQDFGKAKK